MNGYVARTMMWFARSVRRMAFEENLEFWIDDRKVFAGEVDDRGEEFGWNGSVYRIDRFEDAGREVRAYLKKA